MSTLPRAPFAVVATPILIVALVSGGACARRAPVEVLREEQFMRRSVGEPFDASEIRVVPARGEWDRVVGPGIAGTLVPEDVRVPLAEGRQRFVPTEEEIRVCELALRDALAEQPFCGGLVGNLAHHFRQYAGAILDGQRAIPINFMCARSSDDWWVEVDDGGPCYARAVCYPAWKFVAGFSCHPSA